MPSGLVYRLGNTELVRVISEAATSQFAKAHKDAVESLLHWYRVTKRAAWDIWSMFARIFRTSSVVDILTVFNISANKYRLVTVIKYRWQVVYIRHIFTHAEYDQEKWTP